MHLSAIAGWSHSGRMNSIMLDYGSAGMDDSEMLKALQQTSLKIHAHLLPVTDAGNSNVVAIKRV